MAKKLVEKAVLVPAGARADGTGEEVAGGVGATVAALNPNALPLFPALGRSGPHPSAIKVIRLDPDWARGECGILHDTSATWDTVRERFGGGTYRLEVLDEQGRLIRGGVSTRTIPGAPRETDGAPGLGGGTVKSLAKVLQAERDFSERLISRAREDAELRIKIAREETESKIAELEAKARLEREREDARRRAELEEARERHNRELERERLAYQARLEEARIAEKAREAAMERERERERETATERVQASERIMSVMLGAIQSNTQTLVAALQSTRTDTSQMLGMFQSGMQLMQNVQQGNQPSEAQQAITMLGHLGEKTLEAYSSSKKADALTEHAKAKALAAGAAPARALAAPSAPPSAAPAPVAGAAPEGAQHNPAPAPLTLEEAKSKMERIRSKAEQVLELMVQRGYDPEEVLEDVRAQVAGEVDPHELEEDEEEELDESAPPAPSSKGARPAPVPSAQRRDAGRAKKAAVASGARADGPPRGRRGRGGGGSKPPVGGAATPPPPGAGPAKVDSE